MLTYNIQSYKLIYYFFSFSFYSQIICIRYISFHFLFYPVNILSYSCKNSIHNLTVTPRTSPADSSLESLNGKEDKLVEIIVSKQKSLSAKLLSENSAFCLPSVISDKQYKSSHH